MNTPEADERIDALESRVQVAEKNQKYLHEILLGSAGVGTELRDRGLLGMNTAILDEVLVLSRQMEGLTRQVGGAADLYEQHRKLLMLMLGVAALMALVMAVGVVLVLSTGQVSAVAQIL